MMLHQTAAGMHPAYCQLWIYVCAKAHYLDMVRQEKLCWEKNAAGARAGPGKGPLTAAGRCEGGY